MKWITFFSQTGSEIMNVIEKTGREPDLIVTNRADLDGVNIKLLNKYRNKIRKLPNKPTANDYYNLINKNNNLFDDCVITLHGYLRIIPDFMCYKYNIYNLHPGLITKYPILKGFNPQEKAFQLKLPTSGSVIHKVTPVLDSGKILKSIEVDIKNLSLDEIYDKIHKSSSQLWVDFLNELENFNLINEKE